MSWICGSRQRGYPSNKKRAQTHSHFLSAHFGTVVRHTSRNTQTISKVPKYQRTDSSLKG